MRYLLDSAKGGVPVHRFYLCTRSSQGRHKEHEATNIARQPTAKPMQVYQRIQLGSRSL